MRGVIVAPQRRTAHVGAESLRQSDNATAAAGAASRALDASTKSDVGRRLLFR
jgi:hypothetical protein